VLRLHIQPAQGRPFDHILEEESLIIGRATTAGLSLADPFLSRQHSRFFQKNGRVFVEDLGSRNGTLVNGHAISAPTEVLAGDVLEVSASVITVSTVQSVAPEPLTPGAAGSVDAAEAAEEVEGTTIYKVASEILGRQTQPGSDGNEHELRRYAERLKILNAVHSALGRPITLDALLELILDRVFDHLHPERALIFLKQPDGTMRRAASRAVGNLKEQFVLSRALSREVAEKGLAALVLDAQTDERFSAAQSILISGVRSIAAAPLLDSDGGPTLGMILVDSKVASRQFGDEDLELLICLASVAALHIRTLALVEEAAERRRMAEELELARRIQMALLPSKLPELPGYEIVGGSTPSRGVSGDYYTVVSRAGGDELVLMISDISGKGMAASLLTASIEALAAGPIDDGLPPDAICSRVSKQLFRRTPPEKYATAFVAVLRLATGEMTYCNAGHNPPFLVRMDGVCEQLAATGVPIGLLQNAEYQAAAVQLAPGDLVVLYTDGIVEAVDPSSQEYGDERLQSLCCSHREAGSAALAAAIDSDLETFVQGVPFHDDRTVLILRRLP
jgi:sigma-B regulation protein RsbU (phosphoserine phosphatase)